MTWVKFEKNFFWVKKTKIPKIFQSTLKMFIIGEMSIFVILCLLVYQRFLKKLISFSGCYGENLARFHSHRLSNWSTGELIDAKNPKPKNGFLALRLCKLSRLILWVLLETGQRPMEDVPANQFSSFTDQAGHIEGQTLN